MLEKGESHSFQKTSPLLFPSKSAANPVQHVQQTSVVMEMLPIYSVQRQLPLVPVDHLKYD